MSKKAISIVCWVLVAGFIGTAVSAGDSTPARKIEIAARLFNRAVEQLAAAHQGMLDQGASPERRLAYQLALRAAWVIGAQALELPDFLLSPFLQSALQVRDSVEAARDRSVQHLPGIPSLVEDINRLIGGTQLGGTMDLDPAKSAKSMRYDAGLFGPLRMRLYNRWNTPALVSLYIHFLAAMGRYFEEAEGVADWPELLSAWQDQQLWVAAELAHIAAEGLKLGEAPSSLSAAIEVATQAEQIDLNGTGPVEVLLAELGGLVQKAQENDLAEVLPRLEKTGKSPLRVSMLPPPSPGPRPINKLTQYLAIYQKPENDLPAHLLRQAIDEGDSALSGQLLELERRRIMAIAWTILVPGESGQAIQLQSGDMKQQIAWVLMMLEQLTNLQRQLETVNKTTNLPAGLFGEQWLGELVVRHGQGIVEPEALSRLRATLEISGQMRRGK